MHSFARFLVLAVFGLQLCGAAGADVRSDVSEVLTSYSRDKLAEFRSADVRVEITDDYGKLAEWDGRLVRFQVGRTLGSFRPVGTVIFPVEVFDRAEKVDAFSIKANVSVYQDIAVASRNIAKGDKISEKDFQMTTQDVALLPKKFFADSKPLLGKEARMGILAGRAILSWMVREEPVVRKSGLITLLSRWGSVRVQASGQALEDGSIGDKIRVQNKTSTKVLRGKVVGPALVEVEVQ